jgi:enoyl-CoA hydratase
VTDTRRPLHVERREVGPNAVALLLTLDRPEALNALSAEMFEALGDALVDAKGDDTVRIILITGRGPAFCAGGDLKSYLELQRDPVAFPKLMDEAHAVFRSMRTLAKPVVCLVNGACVAGGLELMLSADFSYAARSARIGDGHLRFGQMGGGGSLSLLPRAITPDRARELVYSARLLSADEALEWGLINRVVDDDALLDAGLEVAAEIAARSPLAVANAKRTLNEGLELGTGVDAALILERDRTAYYCLTADDAQEGLRAFAEKRKPRFTGR